MDAVETQLVIKYGSMRKAWERWVEVQQMDGETLGDLRKNMSDNFSYDEQQAIKLFNRKLDRR